MAGSRNDIRTEPRPEPIVPARIDWRADGPWAIDFDDRYASEVGSAEQSRHVFLGGNDLPARWRSRARFVILETGLGLGGNLLATWAAWRDDPARATRLFYIGVEAHPPAADELRRAHAGSAFETLANELADAWPPPVAGLHRLDFEDGRLVLLLGVGDIEAVLSQLDARVDAIYLDGFAPDRNPAMWSGAVARATRSLAAPDATLATWTVSRAVRDAWRDAGFVLERRDGLAPKRDMTTGRVAESDAASIPDALREGARVAVVGAGLAGAAVAEALARRGYEVDVVDALGIARATSGNRLAAIQPVIARDENATARFTRTAFLATLHRLARLDAIGADDAAIARLDGLLRLVDEDIGTLRAQASRLGLPPTLAHAVDAAEATVLAGVPIARAGWWFPRGGWLRPAAWSERLIASQDARVTVHLARVQAIETHADSRIVVLDDGRRIEADAVVLANADAASALVPAIASMQRLRGQLSDWPTDALTDPRVVVAGDGYVMPAVDGRVLVGATYEFDGDPTDATPLDAAHANNRSRAARLVGALPATGSSPDGRVGWRAVNSDRLPSIGAVADQVWCLVGLGSRGATWAALGAEQVVAQLAGDPLPLERRLAQALDPLRFERRRRSGR